MLQELLVEVRVQVNGGAHEPLGWDMVYRDRDPWLRREPNPCGDLVCPDRYVLGPHCGIALMPVRCIRSGHVVQHV